MGSSRSLGPTFDLSKLSPTQRIAAEADLVAGGLLIDIKTTLAPKNKVGLRPDVLKADDVYQLLGYALLDYSNQYNIDRLGIYSARYGKLTEWPLERVTSLMSGRKFDFPAALTGKYTREVGHSPASSFDFVSALPWLPT